MLFEWREKYKTTVLINSTHSNYSVNILFFLPLLVYSSLFRLRVHFLYKKQYFSNKLRKKTEIEQMHLWNESILKYLSCTLFVYQMSMFFLVAIDVQKHNSSRIIANDLLCMCMFFCCLLHHINPFTTPVFFFLC